MEENYDATEELVYESADQQMNNCECEECGECQDVPKKEMTRAEAEAMIYAKDQQINLMTKQLKNLQESHKKDIEMFNRTIQMIMGVAMETSQNMMADAKRNALYLKQIGEVIEKGGNM